MDLYQRQGVAVAEGRHHHLLFRCAFFFNSTPLISILICVLSTASPECVTVRKFAKHDFHALLINENLSDIIS